MTSNQSYIAFPRPVFGEIYVGDFLSFKNRRGHNNTTNGRIESKEAVCQTALIERSKAKHIRLAGVG